MSCSSQRICCFGDVFNRSSADSVSTGEIENQLHRQCDNIRCTADITGCSAGTIARRSDQCRRGHGIAEKRIGDGRTSGNNSRVQHTSRGATRREVSSGAGNVERDLSLPVHVRVFTDEGPQIWKSTSPPQVSQVIHETCQSRETCNGLLVQVSICRWVHSRSPGTPLCCSGPTPLLSPVGLPLCRCLHSIVICFVGCSGGILPLLFSIPFWYAGSQVTRLSIASCLTNQNLKITSRMFTLTKELSFLRTQDVTEDNESLEDTKRSSKQIRGKTSDLRRAKVREQSVVSCYEAIGYTVCTDRDLCSGEWFSADVH